jgi:hypothetical protein
MAIFRARAERAELAAAPRRFVMRGRIATLDTNSRVIPDGYVCVENDLIASVTAADVGIPAPFQQAPLIPTGGTIYSISQQNVIRDWKLAKAWLRRELTR